MLHNAYWLDIKYHTSMKFRLCTGHLVFLRYRNTALVLTWWAGHVAQLRVEEMQQHFGRNTSWKKKWKGVCTLRRLELTADCLIVLSILLYVTSVLSHVRSWILLPGSQFILPKLYLVVMEFHFELVKIEPLFSLLYVQVMKVIPGCEAKRVKLLIRREEQSGGCLLVVQTRVSSCRKTHSNHSCKKSHPYHKTG